MKVCKKCVMLETRPRLTFDENGVCAACQWAEEKKTRIDWKSRQKELADLCDEIRGKNLYDCIVPVSGGKDSSYVADKMKNEYKLNVLTVTITPPLESDLIQKNLQNFLEIGGFNNIKVTPNPAIAREINKFGLIEQGRPLLSWTSCLNSVVFRLAAVMGIPLIMFGEEGESEYGGSTKLRYTPYYTVEDAIELYTYGNKPEQYLSKYTKEELRLWMYPSEEDGRTKNVKIAHWSYFENWDPYKHYLFAKNNYGMKEREELSTGTYTNFGQLDTVLYDLHVYFMYLKFGFGRCSQDACIDIRNGRLSREQAKDLVQKYDGILNPDYIDEYLNYFEITKDEFDKIISRHVNKDLFEKKNGEWKRKFVID